MWSSQTKLHVYRNNKIMVKGTDSEAWFGDYEPNRIWLWQNRDSVSFLAT